MNSAGALVIWPEYYPNESLMSRRGEKQGRDNTLGGVLNSWKNLIPPIRATLFLRRLSEILECVRIVLETLVHLNYRVGQIFVFRLKPRGLCRGRLPKSYRKSL